MDARPPLTRRQAAVLDLIRTKVRERGYPPSTREIGDAVGLASTSSVAHVVQTLQARGYIQCGPRNSRTITILNDPEDPPPVDAGLHPTLSRHTYGTDVYAVRNTCPGCQTPNLNTTVGITRVGYTIEVCTCRDDDHTYDHLVEQLWHRDCLTRSACGDQG